MIYLELFWTFLKIGTFTFGGGYAMIPLIQEEVLSKAWMESEALINFIAISESSPGPFAINIATFVGTMKGGFLGAVCATLGVVFTSFVLILIVAKNYEKYKNSKIVKGIMTGLKPTVIGLIMSAVISTFMTVFFPEGLMISVLSTISFWKSMFIFSLSLVLVFMKVHPIKVILSSAFLGIILGFI